MIKTLKELPHKREETIRLIESAFDYSSCNSFAVDFYPLLDKKNATNNYLLLAEDEVIGHIGILYKTLKLEEKNFSIPMIGGIALASSHRGSGKFKLFFNEVLSSLSESAFTLLWSDKIELYESFGFHPCLEQFEYTGSTELDNPAFIKMKLAQLNDNEIQQLSELYNQSPELRYSRSLNDWRQLKEITSSDIYVKKIGDLICNYFFMNKGEDLTDVIYEYGSIDDIEEISTYGILWSPWSFEVENEEHKTVLYAALLKVVDMENFKSFISLYCNDIIRLEGIESGEVSFIFESKKMKLSIKDFLCGVFGPNRFSELDALKKISISGLDSI